MDPILNIQLKIITIVRNVNVLARGSAMLFEFVIVYISHKLHTGVEVCCVIYLTCYAIGGEIKLNIFESGYAACRPKCVRGLATPML